MWRTVRSLGPYCPPVNFNSHQSQTCSLVQGRTVRAPGADCPPFNFEAYKRDTLSGTTFEIKWRTIRPPGPDRPRAHQRHCKLSGTGADCPPLWCGLSAVTQSALELSLISKLFKMPLALMHATRHFEQNGTKDPSSMSTQPLLIVRLSIQQIRSLFIH